MAGRKPMLNKAFNVANKYLMSDVRLQTSGTEVLSYPIPAIYSYAD